MFTKKSKGKKSPKYLKMPGMKSSGNKKGDEFSGDKVSRTLQYEGVKNLASIS